MEAIIDMLSKYTMGINYIIVLEKDKGNYFYTSFRKRQRESVIVLFLKETKEISLHPCSQKGQ